MANVIDSTGTSNTSWSISQLVLDSSNVTTTYTLKYPAATGSANQVLKTDGSGNLSWYTPTSGTVTSVAVSGGSTGLTTSGGPITSSGTITIAGTLAIANGGTGATTAAGAMTALSPITTTGDIIYSSSGTTNSRLGVGSAGQVLTVAAGVPSWATPSSGNALTSHYVGYGSASNVLTGGTLLQFNPIGIGGASPLLTIGDTTLTGGSSANITTPNGSSFSGNGADLNISTGLDYASGSGNRGGNISIAAGNGLGTVGTGGGVSIIAGYGTSVDGSITMTFGGSTSPITSGNLIIKSVASGGATEILRMNKNGALSPGSATNNWGTSGYFLTSQGSSSAPIWSAGGTVTTVSVVSANGFAGTVATATTTPAITLTTTITGIIKGNGTALSAAVAGDFPTLNQNTTGNATTATNLAGGIASQVPYQTGAGATAFVANGTSGQVLTSNGTSAPTWQTSGSGTTFLQIMGYMEQRI